MEDIDFLPEAYRRKCQKKHWVMRRIYISAIAAGMLIIFVAWDQYDIHQRRIRILPRLKNQLMKLEQNRIQQSDLLLQLREVSYERERIYMTLLRVSRSRVISGVIEMVPEATQIQSLNLMSQPEIWVASPLSLQNQPERLSYELERLARLHATSQLQLTICGTAPGMNAIHQYEKQLGDSGLFANVKLQETRQNGRHFEFQFLATVVNPFKDLATHTDSRSPLAESPELRLPLKAVSLESSHHDSY